MKKEPMAMWPAVLIVGVSLGVLAFGIAAYVYAGQANGASWAWCVWIAGSGGAVGVGWIIWSLTTRLDHSWYSGGGAPAFGKARLGLGLTLLVVGLVVSGFVAGFARAGKIRSVFPLPTEFNLGELPALEALREELRPAADGGAKPDPESREFLLEVLDEMAHLVVVGADEPSAIEQVTETRKGMLDDMSKLLRISPNQEVKDDIYALAGFLRDWHAAHRIESKDVAARILIATLLGIFGALFWVLQCLRKKEKTELFDHNLFFAGLWFRLGEVVLFILLLFLLLRSDFDAPTGFSEAALPLMALLIGMYVKTAETAFRALGERMLAAVGGFFTLETTPATPPTKLDLWYQSVIEVGGGKIDAGELEATLSDPDFEPSTATLKVTLKPTKDAPAGAVAEDEVEQAIRFHLDLPEVRDLEHATPRVIEIRNLDQLRKDGFVS